MRIAVLLAALLLAPSAGAERSRALPPANDAVVRVAHNAAVDHPTRGPALAPVTIDFFINLGDGRTSYEVHRSLEVLAQRHPTRLRLRYRISSRSSRPQVYDELAREAFAQGRFFEFLDAYYQTNSLRPRASDIDEIASAAGMDLQRKTLALADGRHAGAVAESYYFRKRYGLRDVPGLLINGVPYAGHIGRRVTIDRLEEAYDEAYEVAQRHLARGVPLEKIYQRSLMDASAETATQTITFGTIDGARPNEPLPEAYPVKQSLLPPNAPSDGAEDPEVVVHFFCTFASKRCSEMARRELKTLAEAYREEVRLHIHAMWRAGTEISEAARAYEEAAQCAAEQDAYWTFYKQGYQHTRRIDVTPEFLLARVDLDEIDIETFEACLETGRRAGEVEAAVERSRLAGIIDTPTVVIGGIAYPGKLDFEDLRVLVERERAPGLLVRPPSP